MVNKKIGMRWISAFLTVGIVSLSPVISACQPNVSAEEVRAVVQATDGQQVILTLPNGNKMVVEAEQKDVNEAKGLVGEDVKVIVEPGDDHPRLVEIEKAEGVEKIDDSPKDALQGTPEDFHFMGIVESIAANTWVVGGKTFQINAATVMDSGLAVGVEADVEFILMSDGSMLATSIETPADDDAVDVDEDFSAMGVITALSANEIVIGTQHFRIDANTILDTGLAVGVEATVEFTLQPDGSMLATSIETAADDDAAGVGEDFPATGIITALTASEVVIGNDHFKIDANTMLDNGLAVGVNATVKFTRQADGSMLALEVETDAPDSPEAADIAEDYRADGTIQAITAASVTVDGITYIIDVNTKLDSGLAPGVVVRIKFIIMPDGKLLAKEVETTNFEEGVNFYFAGPIQSTGAAAWVVGGKTFAVTPTTRFDEGLAVGLNANVEFIIKADGSFQAVHIENSGFKFVGIIQAISPYAYAVSGHLFKTSLDTIIERGLKVGKLVQVNFIIQPDGSLLALQIKIPKTKVQSFTFKGVVQYLTATSIKITGETFQITPTTAIGLGVAVGKEVNVTFDIKPGNVLVATYIQDAKAVAR